MTSCAMHFEILQGNNFYQNKASYLPIFLPLLFFNFIEYSFLLLQNTGLITHNRVSFLKKCRIIWLKHLSKHKW